MLFCVLFIRIVSSAHWKHCFRPMEAVIPPIRSDPSAHQKQPFRPMEASQLRLDSRQHFSYLGDAGFHVGYVAVLFVAP